MYLLMTLPSSLMNSSSCPPPPLLTLLDPEGPFARPLRDCLMQRTCSVASKPRLSDHLGQPYIHPNRQTCRVKPSRRAAHTATHRDDDVGEDDAR